MTSQPQLDHRQNVRVKIFSVFWLLHITFMMMKSFMRNSEGNIRVNKWAPAGVLSIPHCFLRPLLLRKHVSFKMLTEQFRSPLQLNFFPTGFWIVVRQLLCLGRRAIIFVSFFDWSSKFILHLFMASILGPSFGLCWAVRIPFSHSLARTKILKAGSKSLECSQMINYFVECSAVAGSSAE